MQVTIDCAKIASANGLHHTFCETLHLPAYYGDNLDALFDCLTSLPDKTTITLQNVQSLINNLGSYGRAALNTIESAERANPQRLTIIMQ